ncbi:TPA: hypothetical protein ACHAEM_003049, partial [Enterococcus faecium]
RCLFAFIRKKKKYWQQKASPTLDIIDPKKETTSTSVVSFLCLCKKQLQIKIMYQAVLHDFL